MGTRVVREGLYFGESPRWHDGRLWYSDFYDHGVHAIDAEGKDEKVVDVDGQSSGLGWLPDGRLLMVSMVDRRLLRVEADGRVVAHADLSGLATGHCNDMVVDAKGRAYVGNFGFDIGAARAPGAARPAAVLALVGTDGSVTAAAEGMEFPNGTVITTDGRTLIIAESLGRKLTAFDIGADGSLSGRRVWADLSRIPVSPDGICLDAEGAVWAANALSPVAVRVAEGGRVLEEVEFSQTCFACMLGGDDGRQLYGLTAVSSIHDDAVAARAGKIEVTTVGVPHAGLP
jgi:sugar lactone lactonase YvrE